VSDDTENIIFIQSGWYISYMNYSATGEGVTSYVAVGGNARHAEKLLKDRLPEHFHPFIVTAPINANVEGEVKKMIEWIPMPAQKILSQIPPVAGEYVTRLHYNLS